MKLADLIRGNCFATATFATHATQTTENHQNVANVATVAVAKARCSAANELARASLATVNQLMSAAQAHRCHFGGWNDKEIERFSARVVHFIGRGLTPPLADNIAELLVLRDRELDTRHVCEECKHFTQRRCQAAARGELPGVDKHLEPMRATLHRCPAFSAALTLDSKGETQ